ncbi:unnamed protein product [Ranitomeya imitator]|uniref:Uncharacterized protein n=1 Tax=Ranitomeya imitator TaxID=111125 RepID=A0ABN9M6U9_9NEOB|nr:unnamed protein product [Ranitomeya imitator]
MQTPDLSPFKNPAKNPSQHEKIQKAGTEGIALKGQQGYPPPARVSHLGDLHPERPVRYSGQVAAVGASARR